MKELFYLVLAVSILILSTAESKAQAVYGSNGEYRGYVQTSPNGVTNVYNANGRMTGSFQTDGGQTSFYSPQGRYEGVSTAPIYTAPNTTIGSPREVPQVRTLGGW